VSESVVSYHTVLHVGWTPLHYAAERDLVSYSRLLVLRGASVTADDRQGVTPMSLATTNNSEQVLRLFRGELNDVQLPVFPADEKNLKAIKESFGDHVEVVKSKLNLLRQELAAATTVDDAMEIMKKIRILKLTLVLEDDDEEEE
jgi:ankyrin repeat protein